MSRESNDPRSLLLNQVIADYLAVVESGNAPDREGFICQYPELAEDLRSFLADHDRMKAAKEGIEAATLPPNQSALEAATIPPNRPDARYVEATLPSSGQVPDVPAVGDKLRYFGDYELLEEIARGGMGVVYKARQVNLNRTVALKMILTGQLASEDDVKRFYTEAEAAANLDHPGIVPIYEVGEHEGQHYFSMGFVEGESLADRLKDGPLSPREAAECTRKIAEAIAFAHEHGVIHRDLKPANVLLQAEGGRPKAEDSRASQHSSSPDIQSTAYSLQPRVTDFGLAKKTEGDSQLTGTGQILGTPSYMPPEQASGKVDEVTELADVYSLGAILYALVTGRPPFQADNPLDTLMQVLEREPVSPRTLNTKVPQDLETISLKCLEKDRHQRYASARDLAAELQRFIHGEPILARPISATARAWRWCRRKPITAGLWASIAVLVLTLAVGGPLAAIRQAALHRAAEQAQRERAMAQVSGLLSASPAAVPVIIDSLQPAYEDLAPVFRDLLESEELSQSEHVHVSLALLASDMEQVDYLSQRMLASEIEEFLLIREYLQPYSQDMLSDLWQCVRDEERDPDHRLRAVCALALYDAPNPAWEQIGGEAAEFLVSQNSLTAGRWMEALRPVSDRLVEPLSEIYGERGEEQAARRILATNILAEYAHDQAEVLVRLLVEADAQQFAVLFPIAARHTDKVIRLLEAELAPKRGMEESGQRSDMEASGCANAALALLRLDGWRAVRPFLGSNADPQIRAYLIRRFYSHGISIQLLASRLEEEHDARLRQALILGLGQYPLSAVPATERGKLDSHLLKIYRDDPHSGVHAACDWLLRRWNRADDLDQLDRQLAEVDAENDHRWYINSQGQTFAVLHEDVFQMGSPETEFGRRDDERLHSRQIANSFAIAVKEVTVAEFHRFLAESPEMTHTYSRRHSPVPRCPQTSVTWYEAAAYCNWLSKTEGIPPSQWCFVPNEDGVYASGMRLADRYLQLEGYRLPTEAEWEYACRGGTTTTRCYGDSEGLLDHYAWYLSNALDRSWPVGEKQPNDFGLFDMHGNVWEWCAEIPAEYPSENRTPVSDELPGAGPVLDGQSRALRGGSYFYHHIYTRAALRNKEPADARYYGIGLRPVRTILERAGGDSHVDLPGTTD